jgi:hypothetical protein
LVPTAFSRLAHGHSPRPARGGAGVPLVDKGWAFLSARRAATWSAHAEPPSHPRRRQIWANPLVYRTEQMGTHYEAIPGLIGAARRLHGGVRPSATSRRSARGGVFQTTSTWVCPAYRAGSPWSNVRRVGIGRAEADSGSADLHRTTKASLARGMKERWWPQRRTPHRLMPAVRPHTTRTRPQTRSGKWALRHPRVRETRAMLRPVTNPQMPSARWASRHPPIQRPRRLLYQKRTAKVRVAIDQDAVDDAARKMGIKH